MKKLLALLLAALMVLSLAACGGKADPTDPADATQDTQSTDAPTDPTDPSVPQVIPEVTYPNDKFDPDTCAAIIGSWKTPVMLDGSVMNMPEFQGTISFDLMITFQDSGLFTISADEKAVIAAIINYENLLAEYMLGGFYSKYAAECKLMGMSETEIEEAWASGGQVDAEIQVENFIASVGLTARFAAIITHGDYYVQNDTLFLSDGGRTYEAYTFLVRNGLLYFVNCSNPAKYMNLFLEFPLPLWPNGVNYEDHPAEDVTPGIDSQHPTVTVPSITEPTDPLPTVPPGFEPIPTMPGGLFPIPTTPEVTDPEATEPVVTDPAATEPTATEPVVTDPTEPEATEKPTLPAEPTDPTEPEATVKPTEPEATEKPTKPTVKPTEPEATEKPTKPTVKPTEPEATEKPTKPTVKPTDPVEPTIDLDELPPVPTTPATKPTEPEATEKPTEPEATEPEATEPDVTPTDPDELPPVVFPTDPDDGPIDTNISWWN